MCHPMQDEAHSMTRDSGTQATIVCHAETVSGVTPGQIFLELQLRTSDGFACELDMVMLLQA